MGTDIHSIAQVKVGQKWQTVDSNIGGDNRSYNTFAVLAGIRNGYGFAGVKTGEGWPVLFETRGIPKDIETEVDDENYMDGTWLGDHNHSWLTLTELMAISDMFVGKTYKVIGMISEKQKEHMDKTGGTPNSWCGWTSQEGYVEAEWEVPAINSLSLLQSIIGRMKELQQLHKIEANEIRFVFGFDS